MSKLKVFVACPYTLFPLDDYKAVFTKVSRSYNVEFIFANEIITNKHVLAKIEGYVDSANFSLFDITGWNPNVTLELGIAVGRRKKYFLLLNQKIEAHKDVPSDIKGIDRIEYTSNTELHSKIIILINQEMPAQTGPKNISFKSLETRILKTLKSNPGLNITKLTDAISVEKNLTQSMVKTMVASGKLKTRGQKKGTNYFSADTDMRTVPRKPAALEKKQSR
jgi:hypothetical protein